MDPFRALNIIVQIAESGSMRAAGEALGVSKSVISYEVRKLEERLGARLLNRSTRSVVLTEAGQLYIERGRHLLNEWRDLEREVSEYHRVPKGNIRIASPPFFGAQFIAPALVDFGSTYPDIKVELECDERMVDIVGGGYDLAIRVTILSETQLVRRMLAPNRLVLVASPEYLKSRGRPSRPIDLLDHVCLRKDDLWGYWTRWLAALAEEERPERLDCAITLSSTFALREAAIAGGGIAILHTYVVAEAIARSDLEVVLPQYPLTYGSICALFPHRHQMPLKTRVLVDFLAQRFRQTPVWEQEIFAAQPVSMDISTGDERLG